MTYFDPAAIRAAAVALSIGAATLASPAIAVDADWEPVWAQSHGYTAHVEGSASLDLAPTKLDFASPKMRIQALPEGPEPRTLKELVAVHSDTELSDEQLECLAGAVYFESKGEPLEGQLAVAEVVINRSRSGRFPASLCGVVKQKSQFSFVRGGRIPPIAKDTPAWRKAVAIARIATNDLAESAVSNALFFHARYVAPGWRGLKRMAAVGNHIFYR
jgi:N-acetylmuramoyl-L-alanine amidase